MPTRKPQFNYLDHLPGWISEWYYNPCSPSPYVFLKATFHALGKLGWTLLEPTPKEVIHQSLRKSWLKALKVELKEVEYLEPVGLLKVQEGVLSCFEVFDMAIWYAFLASITNDALADWTSQVYRLEGCKGDPNQLEGYSEHPVAGSFQQGDWQDAPNFDEARGDFGGYLNSQIDIPEGGSATVTCQLAALNGATNEPVGIDVRIVTQDNVPIIQPSGIFGHDWDGSKASVVSAHDIPHSPHIRQLKAQYRINENFHPLFAFFVAYKSKLWVTQRYPHN